MGMKFANNAGTTLAAGVAPTDLTVTVNTTQGANFPALAAGDYFYLTLQSVTTPTTIEVVKVTAVAGNVFTIVRAQDGTTAQSFNISDRAELRLCAVTLNDLPKLDEANTFQKIITAALGLIIQAGGLSIQAGGIGVVGGASVAGGLSLTDSQLSFPDNSVLKSNLNLCYRNKIRNPKMEIAQRGTNFPATANNYTLDGWLTTSAVTTAVSTISQVANPMAATSDCQFALKVQVTTADAAVTATKLNSVGQCIEGYLVRDCVGQPVSIRFEVSSPKAGQHYVALVNSGLDRSYILPYNIAVANTPQLVTLSLPAGLITAGTWNYTNGTGIKLWFPLMVGANFQTATTGSWQVGHFHSGNGQQNLLDTIGNVFTVTGVQFERAPSSSPLEHLDIGLEQHKNFRYLWISSAQGNPIFAGQCFSATQVAGVLTLPAPLRAAPAVSISSMYCLQAGATAQVLNSLTVNANTNNQHFYMFGTAAAAVLIAGNSSLIVTGTGGITGTLTLASELT